MASKTFKTHQKRQIIRILCAIGITFIVQYFFAALHSYWMLFATVFVMLTKRGSALYQGLLHFFILIFFALFIGGPAEVIVYGALIGILCNLLILPDHVEIEFREALIPVVLAFDTYFSAIAHLMLEKNVAFAERATIDVEKKLLSMPSFIFDPGFDITMRRGHQYFFMKIGQLSEILFSLHHVARYEYDQELLEEIRSPLIRCIEKIHALSIGLTTVLELKPLPGALEDFYADIAEIERIFKYLIPLKLDALDLEKKFVFFALFVANLKEFHDALLRLAKTLR